MLCTFCGTDNRAENKFCGMCGVRLERRKTDRRVSASSASLKCPSCRNVNEPGYKFCGMCGGRIERRVADRRGTGVEHPRAQAVANVALPTPEHSSSRPPEPSRAPAPRAVDVLPHPERPASIFKSEPGETRAGIQGPSFLGLSDEPEGEGDYLLEEEHSGGGLRKLVLLAILAAILGLIFVQWRSSFRASPRPAESPASEPTPSPPGPQGAVQSSPSPSPAPQGLEPFATAEASTHDPAAKPQPSPGTENPFADNGKQALQQAFGSRANIPAPPENTPTPAENQKSAKNSFDDGSNQAPARPSSMLIKAQQYLQGAPGVAQNCEQGLVYLRAAAQKNDPAAAVQMGALYASGHCVKQDRVMAYRWFNSAHELQPSNQWIQKNLDLLLAQMTPDERRQTGD